jgi:hypothetical protein
MGQVIIFQVRQQPGCAPAGGGPAQILFFTGVRYQRDDPDAGSPAPDTPAPHTPAPRESRGAGRHRRGG